MSRIYVASSWRNVRQPIVVRLLRANGHEVYDFRNPREGEYGFHWSGIMPSYARKDNGDQICDQAEFVGYLEHPTVIAGFNSDFDAMEWADTCVLVLPCGRSAHLELGWAVGVGKRTAVLLDGPKVNPGDHVQDG